MKNRLKRQHQEYWKHAPHSKNLRLSSPLINYDNLYIKLLPDRITPSKASIKEPNLIKDSDRYRIGYINIENMHFRKSQPKPPSPMKCFPQQTDTCDDMPNTTDIRVSHDDHMESNSLTEESQEQHATPAQYKTLVTTDDIDTITEETIFS
eukprot:TRINITY_DN3411_c0_g1_i10.p1 TRINITY_DN3411_c0_g1~~TRINITY_DN3411_c0_g1_i10.p1  ORF type:complete len:151 (+),score=14.30 TRINITY_DN3411_c0_g1_i10:46-498(+)